MDAELTYYAAIAYALLYLASVISVCTAVVIRKINSIRKKNLIHLWGYDEQQLRTPGMIKMYIIRQEMAKKRINDVIAHIK